MAEEQTVVSVPELLLRNGLVTREQLNEAVRRKRDEDKTLGQILFEMGVINEPKKLELFKRHFGLEVVSLKNFKISPADMTMLPRSFCVRNCLVPILRERGSLIVAIEDPTNVVVLDEAASLASMSIHPVIASCEDVIQSLAHYPEKHPEEATVEQKATIRRQSLLHDLLFVIAALLPIPIFFGLLAYNQDIQRFFINQLEAYEKILLFFMAWALWAASVYEIDGLILKRSEDANS